MRKRARPSTSIIVVLLTSTLTLGCHLSDRELAAADATAVDVPAPIVTGPPPDSPGSPDGGAAIDAGAPLDAPTSDDAPALD
jgi:hypothetical protein